MRQNTSDSVIFSLVYTSHPGSIYAELVQIYLHFSTSFIVCTRTPYLIKLRLYLIVGNQFKLPEISLLVLKMSMGNDRYYHSTMDSCKECIRVNRKILTKVFSIC